MWVGKALFRSVASETRTCEDHHLAQMMEIAKVSRYPSALLGKGETFFDFFEKDGSLLFAHR
jgi:hypothetical protein